MKEIEEIDAAQEDANRLVELGEADLFESDSFLHAPAENSVHPGDSKLDIDLEDLLADLK